MAGKVLELEDLIQPDQMAATIADFWQSWNTLRQSWLAATQETRSYIYATDTTQTTNGKLPWKNKTTVPKLCQIRDNLHANYLRTLFPKRKWVYWEAYEQNSSDQDKRAAIESFMADAMDRSDFKNTASKLLYDWIDYGNCFATIEWQDDTQQLDTHDQVGYVGPVLRRISPLDIVFNPIAPDFAHSPKIVRTLTSLGEVQEILQRTSTDDTRQANEDLFKYLLDIRKAASNHPGEIRSKDAAMQIDGFNNWNDYLASSYCEVLTFYGDLFDTETQKFYRNYKIMIVDRHKIIMKAPNPSFFGRPPIFHAGWRLRQDNLWAMGPLDNLVGMQYRIDHLENLKADVFDLVAFPLLKIKGYVDDFEWEPMARIFVGDDGDVEMIAPDVAALNADTQIALLEQKMEEMAGSPKEAMGFRTPGEKTKYEVQRLENAAGRIFQAKIEQYEELIIEPALNAMLELARRNMTSQYVSRVFDDEFKATTFQSLSPEDITGQGRVKPVAARHFGEQAERVQNATAFFGSPVGQDQAVNVHYSGLQVAEMFEDLLDLGGYKLVTPYVRITEQAEAQRLANTTMEQTQMQAGTPSGLTPDDTSGPPVPPANGP